jgi:Tfp pilus assembly protein FimT
MVELVAVLAVISIVVTFSVIGVKRAMAAIRLQNSMRQLASRLELARTDAIRRHRFSEIMFKDSRTYEIKMDFDGKGVEATRSYTFESGVAIPSPTPDASGVTPAADYPVFSFDWRGRTPQCFTSLTLKSAEGGGSSTLSVSSAGDVTVDAGLSANLNAGTFANINQTGDVQKGAVVAGTSSLCNDPCGGCASKVCTTCDSPSTPPTGCVGFTLKAPTFVSIRKNYRTSAGLTVSVTAADTITVVQNDGRTNLEFTPLPTQAIAAGGSKVFTVKSKNNLTGTFTIKFISACSPTNVAYATVEVKP